MIRAIIFDFDGLIVDTETVWYEVFREVFAEHGCELALADFAKCIGTTDEELYAHYYANARIQVEQKVLQQLAHDRYAGRMSGLELREGVLDYLEQARELGVKIGLASSSSHKWILGFLERFGIASYFEVMKTKEDVALVKPDPALYIQAAAALGTAPEETVAFEDSLNGSLAAYRAGLHCVVVPNSVTAHLPFEHHALRLSSMKEMPLKAVLQYVQGEADGH